MKIDAKLGVIFFVLCLFLFFLWYNILVPHFEKLDDKANDEFAEKARQLQIMGKSRRYVIKHFGEPHRSEEADNDEILVYIPGPKLALWNSECRIRVDGKTGVVIGWHAHSD